ncbi:MAG: sugar ABC transporter permease [Clostridia bacterium]|nr:sugar ABC transporter permease [Clostridia bacterium]
MEISRTKTPNPRQRNLRKRRGMIEFLYILPFLILVALFSYFPLYGWRYAFHDFVPPTPISSETFVGFKWFASLFSNPVKTADVIRVMRNTLAMSGISLFFSWFPMVFAVFLNEIKSKPYRKFVQTATTLPNFISWVLVFSIAFNVFGSNGAVNAVLKDLGLIDRSISFLKSSDNLWFRMWLWLTWKNAGWAAIMYLAAISAIDEQMIEAAKVDGATRMQIIWHITIPSILPTYFVIVMLNIASFLSNGMEQYYVFQNAFNQDWIEVLDLYVYNIATSGRGNYPLATAISILKSIVSILLLTGANGLSKLIRGESFI